MNHYITYHPEFLIFTIQAPVIWGVGYSAAQSLNDAKHNFRYEDSMAKKLGLKWKDLITVKATKKLADAARRNRFIDWYFNEEGEAELRIT